MYSLTRHKNGPILVPNKDFPWENEGVFNPGAIDTGEEIIMLYRAVGETDNYISRLGLAKSTDGVTFKRVFDEPVYGPKETFDKWGTEDPRICKIENDFYITYVALSQPVKQNGAFTPNLETATALLKTKDFISFENLGVISPRGSDNKDVVIFPKKINERYWMLHRPNHWHRTYCDHLTSIGQTLEWPCDINELPQNPSIWIASSDNLKDWTDHKVFLQSSMQGDSKIGPGLPPIETEEGWLIIYHHVIFTETKDSFSYSIRAALFDINDPSRQIGKLAHHILQPEMPYEKEKASSVIFPTGGYVKDDILYVYYGASDKYVCLATGSLSELLRELKESQTTENNNVNF